MRRRRDLLHPAALAAVVLAVGGFVRSVEGAEAAKPNVLWLTCEDIGPELGCYGDAYADTPNLDRLAGQGMLPR